MSEETKARDRALVKDYVAALRKLEEADSEYSAAVRKQTEASVRLAQAGKALSVLVGANVVERNFKVDSATVLQVAFVEKAEPHVQLLTVEE